MAPFRLWLNSSLPLVLGVVPLLCESYEQPCPPPHTSHAIIVPDGEATSRLVRGIKQLGCTVEKHDDDLEETINTDIVQTAGQQKGHSPRRETNK